MLRRRPFGGTIDPVPSYGVISPLYHADAVIVPSPLFWERSKMQMQNKIWQDLSMAQRVGAIIMGGIQIALLVAALMDIRRRPAEQIKGSKRLWTALAFVNYIGPLAYFLVGIKRPEAEEIVEEGIAIGE
jgi:hypothetical protein